MTTMMTETTTVAEITITTIIPSGHLLDLKIDARSDADAIQEQIDTFMESARDADHQEFEVINYTTDIMPPCIAQNINPEKWVEYMEAYEEHGGAFRAYVDDQHYAGGELSDTLSRFEDAYRGEYDDQEDFARELLDETGEIGDIPEHLRHYFDYEAYARDLFMSDVYSLDNPNGGIFVYWNN